MTELREVFEMATKQVEPDLDSWRDQERRQQKARHRRRMGAIAVAAAIGLVAIVVILANRPGGDTSTPADQPSKVNQADVIPALNRDYMIDLDTGVRTPLPKPILRSLGEAGPNDEYRFYRYAASSDGSLLAYVGTCEEGTPQIFIADIDRPRVRQMTHDPTGATSPAWSPDGAFIAYEGFGGGDVQNLFVLEIATGETRHITDGTRDVWAPSFTPDGSSLVYTDPGRASDAAEMRTVRITGGRSTILFGGGHGGMGHAGSGSMSPDGSRVTMTGHEINGPGALLLVSNTDGSHRRSFPAWGTNPAGTWPPDGSHIVGLGQGYRRGLILVIDVATGDTTRVAEGTEAIWLDDHTLLVEA